MNPTAQLLTAEDLEKLPADGMRHELVKGELRTMPPSGGEHGYTVVNLTVPLGQHARRQGLGAVCGAETGFVIAHDPDTVRAPDIAFVRKAAIPASGLPKGFWQGAPDLAVEVVSPGDTLVEVEEKVHEWLQAGTSRVWVVNPRQQTVHVYRSPTDVMILTVNDVLDGEGVVPGFTIPVREIFA